MDTFEGGLNPFKSGRKFLLETLKWWVPRQDSLNPFKSGRKFLRYEIIVKPKEVKGLNPFKSGRKFLQVRQARYHLECDPVSIPSNQVGSSYDITFK